jgi:hypothetical protein
MVTDTLARRGRPAARVGRVVVGLYLAACFLPCIDCGPVVDGWGDGGTHNGLVLLLLGGSGGNNGVPWSANVFLALGLLCLWSGGPRAAAALGVLASLLGLTTWWVRRDNTFLVGYYAWQASQLVLAGGSMWVARKSAGRAVGAGEGAAMTLPAVLRDEARA